MEEEKRSEKRSRPVNEALLHYNVVNVTYVIQKRERKKERKKKKRKIREK